MGLKISALCKKIPEMTPSLQEKYCSWLGQFSFSSKQKLSHRLFRDIHLFPTVTYYSTKTCFLKYCSTTTKDRMATMLN